MWNLITTLGLFLLLVPPNSAGDFAKLDRTIKKEPVYQTKSPQYCLLVFGPEAKTRVWLVVDGDAIYVDKNANGDLTEPGKRLSLSKRDRASWPQYAEQREVYGITITDGRFKHTDLSITQLSIRPDLEGKSEADEQLRQLVRKEPKTLVYILRINVEYRGLPNGKLDFTGRVSQSAGQDENGYLQFASTPQDTPVIHFGGPWEMGLEIKHSLVSGDKPADLRTVIGTPGHGHGTFASILYDGIITNDTYPTAAIEFPAQSGKAPIKQTFVLKHRC